jgi:REP element-mobilizing transposase RayT
MSRPPRIEFAGAIHHVRARGTGRQVIVADEFDLVALTGHLARVVEQMEWSCHAYCFMTNHFHLLVETPKPNLGQGMQRLCGRYAQGFNHRYGRYGHLFEGRYRTTIVSREPHLAELARYLVLNPVRAGICGDPAHWRWSSYRATAGLDAAPSFLAVGAVLSTFAADAELARERYREFVAEGRRHSTGHDRGLTPGFTPRLAALPGMGMAGV